MDDGRFYSIRKLLTGFAAAALIARKPTVIAAMAVTTSAAIANIHHDIFVLYAKSCNQLFITYQATGAAITNDHITNFKKSPDNMNTILFTVAPNVFRIPISFVFCKAV